MEMKTLEFALQEGIRRGYRYCTPPWGGTRTIAECLEELDDGPSPKEYILINEFIFRPEDAWKGVADIYTLSY